MIDSSTNRTRVANLNIFFSVFIKAFGIFTNLALVPLTLNYLNPKEYGIWLTLNSILLWINNFDIGLGNGLRNKLTEALALKDLKKAKAYVSTAYVIVSIITFVIFFTFLLFNYFMDWYKILNLKREDIPNLESIVLISFSLFCINFVLKLIGNVLLAMQKTAIDNLLIFLGQLFSLIWIYCLTLYSKGNLFNVALVYSLTPIIVYSLAYPFVFHGNLKRIAPSLRCFERVYVKQLTGLGLQFFILQISGLVIFSTTNVLIMSMFGPDSVTVYNIAFKYYNVVPIFFSIVLAPIWSATTDAYANKDFLWINQSMNKIKLLLVITFFGIILMTILSDKIYELWVGETIKIPLIMSILIGAYNFLLVASLSYSSFLNGIGKLRLQMVNTFICALLFIPFVFIFTKYLAIYGILTSLILVNVSGLIFNIVQFNKIVDNRASGIWSR